MNMLFNEPVLVKLLFAEKPDKLECLQLRKATTGIGIHNKQLLEDDFCQAIYFCDFGMCNQHWANMVQMA